jgi:hypothetical protein
MNISGHVAEMYEQGFTVLPAYFDSAAIQKQRDILDSYMNGHANPSQQTGNFGFTIHPMMPNVPEMAPFLDVPEAIEIAGGAMKDEVRLAHLGARISGAQSSPRIDWHHHYPNGNGWEEENLLKRDRIERLLIGFYPDGTMPEVGPLIAMPRRLNDPLGEPLGDRLEAWPDEQRVEAPPGSIVIFDTALWHSAARGTGDALRHLWGTHCQGWSDPRPHPEDNLVDAPEIAEYKNKHPRLKKLIDG